MTEAEHDYCVSIQFSTGVSHTRYFDASFLIP
jgi:hypothetical protein